MLKDLFVFWYLLFNSANLTFCLSFVYVQQKRRGKGKLAKWKGRTRSTQRRCLGLTLNPWTCQQPSVSLIRFFHLHIKYHNPLDSEMIEPGFHFKKIPLSPDRSLSKSNTGSEGTSGSGPGGVNPSYVWWPEWRLWCSAVAHGHYITNSHIPFVGLLCLYYLF